MEAQIRMEQTSLSREVIGNFTPQRNNWVNWAFPLLGLVTAYVLGAGRAKPATSPAGKTTEVPDP